MWENFRLSALKTNGKNEKVNINDSNIDRRILKAKSSFWKYKNTIWCNRHISLKTKKQLYTSLVLSVLYYSIDTCALYRKHILKLQRFVKKCYKMILNIPNGMKVDENELCDILNMDNVVNYVKKKS